MLWVISSIFAMIGAAVSWTFGLIWLLLTLIARWLVFQKAGEQGWKSVVPLYNDYTAYKIAWEPNMFWAWLAFTLVGNMAENAADGRFWSIPGMLGGICALAVTLIVLGYSMNMAKSFYLIGNAVFNETTRQGVPSLPSQIISAHPDPANISDTAHCRIQESS